MKVAEIKSSWYAIRIHKQNGEQKIKERFEKLINEKLLTGVLEVLVPVEKYYKNVAGKTTVRERNLLPGYIILEIEDDKLGEAGVDIRNNMVGVGAILMTPLKQSEVERLVEVHRKDVSTSDISFTSGNFVKIVDGPFADFDGVITTVDEPKKRLKVEVKVFGRATPVDLSFKQVKLQQ